MVFGQLLTQHDVLKESKGAVKEIFVHGHAATKGSCAERPGAKHHLVNVVGYQVSHGRDQLGRILVVRVKHNDDVAAKLQGLFIAALLIAAISPVLIMLDNMGYTKLFSDGNG